MKRSIFIITLLLTVLILFAQAEADQEVEEAMQELEEEMQEVRVEMEKVSDSGEIIVRTTTRGSGRAYMGVYAADLSISKAQDLNYSGEYGIVINRISSNSPAQKYNLMSNDILMRIDNHEMKNYKTFVRVLRGYSPGEEAMLTIFRGGKEIQIDFKFGSVGTSFETEYFDTSDYADNSKETGRGGFGWTPQIYQPDMDDINHIMEEFGFSKIDDNGLFMHGLHGNFHVGKKFYLGGSYYWYPELSRSRNYVTPDGIYTTRKLRYWTKYWGVSLDRRFRLASWLTSSIGFTVGKSESMIKVTQTSSQAGDVTWENISEGMDLNGNNQIELKKEYIIFHPRLATYIKILDWLRIRAEAGYMLGYSWHSGWSAKMMDRSFDMEDSPNTSYNGLTFSIGPWLGF